MASNDEGVADKDTTKVEQTERGISIETTLTRGTGTYDRDFIKGVLEKETLEEVLEDLDRFRALLEEQAEWSRDIQPALDVDSIIELAEEKDIVHELFYQLSALQEDQDSTD